MSYRQWSETMRGPASCGRTMGMLKDRVKAHILSLGGQRCWSSLLGSNMLICDQHLQNTQNRSCS